MRNVDYHVLLLQMNVINEISSAEDRAARGGDAIEEIHDFPLRMLHGITFDDGNQFRLVRIPVLPSRKARIIDQVLAADGFAKITPLFGFAYDVNINIII